MIVYPSTLSPTSFESVQLPTREVLQIAKASQSFVLWKGKPVEDTYGHKAILSDHGKPAFAELIVLRTFIHEGWEGVWVDSFRSKFRTQYWPADEVKLPDRAKELFDSIKRINGTARGCWDVFCWKDGAVVFVECKRKKTDTIRNSQRKWLASAIKSGLSLDSFMIVEWTAAHGWAANSV